MARAVQASVSTITIRAFARSLLVILFTRGGFGYRRGGRL